MLGLAERRHEFATMAALGTSLREIGAFLWSEAAIVLAGGLALAALLGWLLAEMLVAMLQHVFDPPPDHLAAPWGFLVGLAGAAVLGALIAAAARRSGSGVCRSARSCASSSSFLSQFVGLPLALVEDGGKRVLAAVDDRDPV